MEWLIKDTKITYEIWFCDDGCPEGSGKKAEELINQFGYNNFKVLYLAEGIKSGKFKYIQSANDSIKGGAVQYGLQEALEENKADIIVYTDADLSSHLGQIGHLCAPIVLDKKSMSLGDRFNDQESVLQECGAFGLPPHTIVTLKVRFWARNHLGLEFQGIRDTQCGFKAIHSKSLSKVFDPKVFNAFFDLHVIHMLASQFPVTCVPIAHVVSE